MNRFSLAVTAAGASILVAGVLAGCGGSGSTAAAPAATATSATAISAPPTSAKLVIMHVETGCHSWGLNGGAPKPSQSTTIAAGGTLSVTDDDVMPHQLVEVSGPAATLSGARMGHTGAVSMVTFTKPGRYTFSTKPGEDYMKGVKTIGPDHVLKLSVTVV